MPRNLLQEIREQNQPRNLIAESQGQVIPRNLLDEKRKGNWEGWIKPTLKEFGEAATKGTVETIGALGSGLVLWPVSKLRGVGELLRGKTVEQARQTEEEIMSMGYQPTSESAKGATGMVGTGFELGLTPARMAGEEVTRMGYPRAGYLTELGGELATFKIVHGLKAKGVEAAKLRSTAKSMLDKKLSELTQKERMYVEELSKAKVFPKNLAEEERRIKQTEIEKAYETQKDVWLGERDVRMLEADVESRLLKKEIKNHEIIKKPTPVPSEAKKVPEIAPQEVVAAKVEPKGIPGAKEPWEIGDKKPITLSSDSLRERYPYVPDEFFDNITSATFSEKAMPKQLGGQLSASKENVMLHELGHMREDLLASTKKLDAEWIGIHKAELEKGLYGDRPGKYGGNRKWAFEDLLEMFGIVQKDLSGFKLMPRELKAITDNPKSVRYVLDNLAKTGHPEVLKANPIRSAAFKMPDGTIYEGTTHPTIAIEQVEKGTVKSHKDFYKSEPGFVTIDGDFITREKALELVGKTEAYSIGEPYGIAEVKHIKHVQKALSEGKPVKYHPRIIDEAIQIYIDTKRNPAHATELYDTLKPEQKKIVDLSQNLPEYAQEIANKIEQSYKSIGAEGLDAAVLKNIIDNYASRQWNLGEDKPVEGLRKFGTKTGHAKARKFDTIIEGWSKGYDLKIKTATENLREYKKEIVKTIEDKRFVGELRKLKTIDGEPLLSTRQLEGYKEVEHLNMNVWEWAGEVEGGKVYGKNFFATEDGQLFERRRLYAPKPQANNLNNMLGISKLAEVPGIKAVTKFNTITKAWILQSSLFHQQAFLRSYYLPGADWGQFKTPRAAYKEGIRSVEALDPVLIHGVRNGLTLGLKQDWSESLLREKTVVGKVLDKWKASREIKDGINNLREAQAEFLFGELGAGLKAKSYMDTFRQQIKKYPNENPDVIAKRVAMLINDDYGGLHLQRLGRNPTLQHIFRLVALAPDWTESNIRTMVKTLTNKNQSQREAWLYRKFWGGVILKGIGITALLNYAMSGGDADKMKRNYEIAWKEGNFNWAKVNITPIYEAFGGEDRRKYFSIFGHFQDPAKFILHPIKSVKHKQSVVAGMVFEALSGTDWAGRGFTTIEDLISDGTVKWGNKKGPIDYNQFPSYVLSQTIGTQPVQVQAAIEYLAGETDGFDAISKSIGLRTTSTYEKKSNKLRSLKGLR